MISTGRYPPCSEPTTGSKSAKYMSPRFTCFHTPPATANGRPPPLMAGENFLPCFHSMPDPLFGFADHGRLSKSRCRIDSPPFPQFGKEIKIANAGNLWIDFIPFNSNKGTALNFLLDKLNLTPSEAVSFGDQQNDQEMLELTDLSYAMAHSKPEIQSRATHTTSSVVQTLCELFEIDP